ncbi:MAG: FecR family protein [Tannerellaceae bacterium]|nr:FecR family protein [Tannerellaceae bacterium]
MENNINSIIIRILNKEASSDEIIEFSQWLNTCEENLQEFQRLKSYWNADISYESSQNPIEAWEKMMRKQEEKKKADDRKKRFTLITKIAAALLLMIGISSLLYFQKHNLYMKETFYTYLSDEHISRATLPDGTKITLNKNSSLTYTNKYTGKNRTVEIKGEVYFDVLKNHQKPFIVRLGEAHVQVLGTSFSVKTNEDHSEITTTLLTGSVRFQSPDQQITLSPNQQISYRRGENHMAIHTVDAMEELLWKDGIIKYRSTSFRDLINLLSEQFEVEIVVNNQELLNSRTRLSGKFTDEQTIDEILEVISRSMSVNWNEKNGTYYIQ